MGDAGRGGIAAIIIGGHITDVDRRSPVAEGDARDPMNASEPSSPQHQATASQDPLRPAPAI